MYCAHCGRQMEADARFCSACGAAMSGMAGVPVRVLLRPREGRLLGGVCAAFANCYGWDISLVRVLAVLLLCVSAGAAALAYFALWILLPEAPYALPGPTTTGTAA